MSLKFPTYEVAEVDVMRPLVSSVLQENDQVSEPLSEDRSLSFSPEMSCETSETKGNMMKREEIK